MRKFGQAASVLILLCNSFVSSGQSDNTVKGSIRFDFMVPQPVSNKAFKKSFTGIMDLATGVFVNIGDVAIGAHARYLQFQVPANKINNTVTDMMSVINPGLSLGYDFHRSEKTMITTGINGGYNWIAYTNVTCSNDTMVLHKKFNGVNLEPFFKIDWMIGDGFGIGVMGAYNLITYEFNPNDICLDEFKTYSDSEKRGLTQSFSFGFCAYWNWSERPRSDY